MRLALALLLALELVASAQVAPQGYKTVQDEGTARQPRPTLNFTGSGVSCTDDAANTRTTCNVTSGGGGGNFLSVTVTFGSSPHAMNAVTTVTGQSWVSASSTILCFPQFASAVNGSNNGVQVVMLMQFSAAVDNLVVGTGFDLYVYTPVGASGSFNFTCTGA